MEIKIKCPSCGKILRLKDAPNINNLTFTCPICKEVHKVGDCQRYIDPPKNPIAGEETQYNYPSQKANNTDETMVFGASQQTAIGRLVAPNGRTYRLNMGINTIGRKASTSQATVQIDTTDQYMSRSHAVIEVKIVGGKAIHIFHNGANKNPSYLNGTLVESSDLLILNDGNVLKLGMTEITFKL